MVRLPDWGGAPPVVRTAKSDDFGDNGGTLPQRISAQAAPLKSFIKNARLGLAVLSPSQAEQASVAAQERANAAKLQDTFQNTTGFVAGVGATGGTGTGNDVYTDPEWLNAQAPGAPWDPTPAREAGWDKVFQKDINTNTKTGKPLTEADLQRKALTQEQYDALSPKQQAAVQFNSLMWNSMDQDRATALPVDAKQIENYSAAYQRVFGEKPSDLKSQFFPATVGLLDEAGFDGTRMSLDDILAGKGTVLDSDLASLESQGQWRFGPKTNVDGVSGALPARQQQAFNIEQLVDNFDDRLANPKATDGPFKGQRLEDIVGKYSGLPGVGGIIENSLKTRDELRKAGKAGGWDQQMRTLLDDQVQDMGGTSTLITQSDLDKAAQQQSMSQQLFGANGNGAAMPSGQPNQSTSLDTIIQSAAMQLSQTTGWNQASVNQYLQKNNIDPNQFYSRADTLMPGFTAAVAAGSLASLMGGSS